MLAGASWLLPDPRRRGEIHFLLAKRLSYAHRLAVIVALLVVGFVLQATVSLLAGAVFLFAATLAAVVKGFSNVPETLGRPTEWRGAGREQLENVLRIARRSRQWDQSTLDVTCIIGQCVLVLVLAIVAAVAYVLWLNNQEWLAAAWVLDTSVLLLPHWLTGVRRVLTNDPLTVKVGLLLKVMDLLERSRREGETAHPQMQMCRSDKGEMPCDAKLVIRFEQLGDAFLGLQVQVTLNNVQGSDYPYLYCVLVARPAMRMADSLQGRPPTGIVVELDRKKAEDVEVLVIRQKTTKDSGYHTSDSACREIFEYALTQCHRLGDS